MELKFRADPQTIFQALTDAGSVQGYTQSKAQIDAKVGGKFSMFDGSIEGFFDQLVPPTKIVQRWRFREWPEDHYSIVDITLSSPSRDECKVVFQQSGIPESDRFGNSGVPAKVRDGWESKIWTRMSKLMGFARIK